MCRRHTRLDSAIVKASSVVVLVVALAALLGVATTASADEGWRISAFDVHDTIRSDGTLVVQETIHADFGQQKHHGIIRYLNEKRACRAAASGVQEPLTPCPTGSKRVYAITNIQVTDGAGKAIPVSQSTSGDSLILKVGDPKVEVSGAQTYEISYEVSGALVAYPDHDELFWDVLGNSPVAVARAQVTVQLPPGANIKAACYEGATGSTEPCSSMAAGSTATYQTTRVLPASQGMTIVTGWQRGLVTVPPPEFSRAKTLRDYFTFDAIEFGGMAAVAAACIALLAGIWWRHGRDRRYKSLYYLTNDPREGTKPLFAHTDVVVEYTPPDDLRPAEMGLILDERADTLDVTATIVDLAVRGFLHITEIPKDGMFGKTDWKLTKTAGTAGDLQTYESRLLDGLFRDGAEVEMSDLKNTFVERLNGVKDSLYADAMKRKWFAERPEQSRNTAMIAGLVVAAIGVVAAGVVGYFFARGLILAPVAVAGVILAAMAPAMARRTATGSEALRRVLGFRLYIATAETRRQAFNEQQNIFAKYLPFAIVFGCVDKWAKAFDGLDDAASQSTSGWYTSTMPFQVAAFSAGLQGFSSSVSSSISSSPASSGGSGFSSGGFSGGGGGGGGVGSW